MNPAGTTTVNRAAAVPSYPPASLSAPPTRSSHLFYFGLALIFVRFSMIQQVIASVIGTNFYMMYWIGIPTVVGLLVSGAFRRPLAHWAGRYWLLFGLWVVLAVPFSFWPGGSFQIMMTYWRVELLMLFAIGGIVTNWRECRRVFVAIAVATLINLLTSRLFGYSDPNERMSLALRTSAVANSNDFAGHLIFVLPLLLWQAMSARRLLVRVLCFLALPYGVYVILASGSRGAAVALMTQVLFLLFFAPSRRRVLIWISAVLFLGLAIAMLPAPTWNRIASIFRDTGAPEEAIESRESRRYLLNKSIEYTFRHPLLGVGPGQFGNYEGAESRAAGVRGSWHETHNSYTEASSECGIPGGMFFILGTVTTFLLLRRAWRQARLDAVPRDVLNAIFCLRLSLVGFSVAVFFLNFAYYFYLPGVAGLAIGITSALESEGRKAGTREIPDSSRQGARPATPLVPA